MDRDIENTTPRIGGFKWREIRGWQKDHERLHPRNRVGRSSLRGFVFGQQLPVLQIESFVGSRALLQGFGSILQ